MGQPQKRAELEGEVLVINKLILESRWKVGEMCEDKRRAKKQGCQEPQSSTVPDGTGRRATLGFQIALDTAKHRRDGFVFCTHYVGPCAPVFIAHLK